jgi:hypothetical protein
MPPELIKQVRIFVINDDRVSINQEFHVASLKGRSLN